MFTNVEGDWDEVMALIKSCVLRLAEDSGRISVVIKIDYRPGVTGALREQARGDRAPPRLAQSDRGRLHAFGVLKRPGSPPPRPLVPRCRAGPSRTGPSGPRSPARRSPCTWPTRHAGPAGRPLPCLRGSPWSGHDMSTRNRAGSSPRRHAALSATPAEQAASRARSCPPERPGARRGLPGDECRHVADARVCRQGAGVLPDGRLSRRVSPRRAIRSTSIPRRARTPPSVTGE